MNPEKPELPAAPLTLEGAGMLHQMMRVRWAAWKALPQEEQKEIVAQAVSLLEPLERNRETPSAVFSLLGHKGDLLFLHVRPGFEELNQIELCLARLKLWDYLEQTTSYLSAVELGLYESSVKVFGSLLEQGLEPHSAKWREAIEAQMAAQRKAMASRLWPEIPANRFLCFYPMDRRRGESRNWYQLPMTERQRMMRDHGQIGRRYAGEVTQIISGSIGFDDWEWGVDLFADDPLVFKRLVYEMRFDEASALYASFGPFYLGRRFPAPALGEFLSGRPGSAA